MNEVTLKKRKKGEEKKQLTKPPKPTQTTIHVNYFRILVLIIINWLCIYIKWLTKYVYIVQITICTFIFYLKIYHVKSRLSMIIHINDQQ